LPTCGRCSGMFTANSMNCLTEALGLSLPGNGSVLATTPIASSCSRKRGTYRRHRAALLRQGWMIVCCRERLRASKRSRRHEPGHRHGRVNQHRPAFARGPRMRLVSLHHGRTSTAVTPVPCLCKVGSRQGRRAYGRCHRAGGIMASWASWPSWSVECRRADRTQRNLARALQRWDIGQTRSESVQRFYRQPLGDVPTQVAFSQDRRWGELDS